jgi:hypothetical protein
MDGLGRGAIALAAVLLLSACAATETIQPTGKVSDVFATPEWAKTGAQRAVAQRAITQNDLLNPDGSCAFTAETATDGVAPATADDALSGQGPLPPVQSGVALGMTECQVVQRTGAPDTFNIGAEGTERITTVTVMRGGSPGLYRFRGGRLVSIERVDVPAPPRTAKSKAKKPAAKQSSGLRGAQQ